MLIRNKPSWEIPEREATPESVYFSRRSFLGASAGLIGAAAMPSMAWSAASHDLYPVDRNDAFTLDRPITDEELATTYNNFYEFGSHKQISRAAQRLEIEPWQVVIDGMVEQEIKIDAHDLIRKMPLEERLYRHRCVERWSMAVPWSGFPLSKIIEKADPKPSAKYVRFVTARRASQMPGLAKTSYYPWPYQEALRMDEAMHELTMVVTGVYGEPLLKQHGAPVRIIVPWKYGYKSPKSIVKIDLVAERPKTFWNTVGPDEYGFFANVNPDVPHPRWSQATEKPLGSEERVPTLLYNGYAESVASLYG